MCRYDIRGDCISRKVKLPNKVSLKTVIGLRSGPEAITLLFYKLNSTEHELILLLNIKMPTTVVILIFISRDK